MNKLLLITILLIIFTDVMKSSVDVQREINRTKVGS